MAKKTAVQVGILSDAGDGDIEYLGESTIRSRTRLSDRAREIETVLRNISEFESGVVASEDTWRQTVGGLRCPKESAPAVVICALS